MDGLQVIILAAGAGTRMHSDRPKVLHRLAGRTLLEHVVATAEALSPEAIFVVYGHGGETLPESLPGLSVEWVRQSEQLGTGHAVQQVLPVLGAGNVLVLYGDVPLLEAPTLERLCESAGGRRLGLLTSHLDDPTGYGRVIRDETGRVRAIVEEADASDAQRRIHEINTGIMSIPIASLGPWLARLDNNNRQSEFYLTDVVAEAVADGFEIVTASVTDTWESLGINDRRQLAECERHYRRRRANELLDRGVTICDPARIDIRGEVAVGRDVSIDVDVILEGRVEIGDDVAIGPFCQIRDARIGDGVRIAAHTVIEDAEIGDGSRIGPFARIRPETRLDESVHIGNFVEVKKSRVGQGSKINHLSYIGDSEIGRGVNIGAGTITCNYDGANKHRTVIEDDAFIGSDSQLVAPVTVGRGATIGAGSTITRDAPADALTLSRSPQKTRTGWQRPRKPGAS